MMVASLSRSNVVQSSTRAELQEMSDDIMFSSHRTKYMKKSPAGSLHFNLWVLAGDQFEEF